MRELKIKKELRFNKAHTDEEVNKMIKKINKKYNIFDAKEEPDANEPGEN